jgi:hypothetical protein
VFLGPFLICIGMETAKGPPTMTTNGEPTLALDQGRAWAADCAEHVLYVFEERYPGESAPRRAIEAARLCVQGLIDLADTRAAAKAAHVAAGYAYATDVAHAAVYAAVYAADAAGYAADAAAGYAATVYAVDAAAGYAEREWQQERRGSYVLGEVPELDLFPGCSIAQREAAVVFWRDGLMLAEAITAARVTVAPD